MQESLKSYNETVSKVTGRRVQSLESSLGAANEEIKRLKADDAYTKDSFIICQIPVNAQQFDIFKHC